MRYFISYSSIIIVLIIILSITISISSSVVALLTVDLTGKKDRMSDFSCLKFFVVADFFLLPGRSHASN